jgi:S1-C subfamily serine protease
MVERDGDVSGPDQRSAAQTEPATTPWSQGQHYGGHGQYNGSQGQYYGRATPYPPPGAPAEGYYYPPGTRQDQDPWAPAAGGGDGGWGGWPPPGGYWAPQPPPPRHHRGLIAGLVIVLVLLMLAAVGVAIGVERALQPASSPTASGNQNGSGRTDPGATGGPTAGTNLDSAAIAAKVDPAVVDVNTVLEYQHGRAAGTGVVIGSSGLVLTNNHVVAGATSITVTEVTDGRTYRATVVGYDRSEDVAVLQMTGASGLATAPIGDSDKVSVGDGVVAIGNAGGTGGTPAVAAGTVTALNQSITASDQSTGSSEQLTGLIQVAADVQSGDSGGPLANSSGQVVGIDTAASVEFRYQASGGTGFAIPINQAVAIAHQIIAGKASTKVHIGETGFLGVQVGSANAATGSGAAVVGVVAGSPADSAGLVAGDVITSVNGRTVDSPTTLTQLLDGFHPGDRVRLGWTDSSGQPQTSTVELIAGPVG